MQKTSRDKRKTERCFELNDEITINKCNITASRTSYGFRDLTSVNHQFLIALNNENQWMHEKQC